MCGPGCPRASSLRPGTALPGGSSPSHQLPCGFLTAVWLLANTERAQRAVPGAPQGAGLPASRCPRSVLGRNSGCESPGLFGFRGFFFLGLLLADLCPPHLLHPPMSSGQDRGSAAGPEAPGNLSTPSSPSAGSPAAWGRSAGGGGTGRAHCRGAGRGLGVEGRCCFLSLVSQVFLSPLCVALVTGTIRKAQNLLKQYSQHGLDGKKGGSNLIPLEGNHPVFLSRSLLLRRVFTPAAGQSLQPQEGLGGNPERGRVGLPVPVPLAPAGAGTGFVALAWSCLADGSSALPGAPLPLPSLSLSLSPV